MAPVRTNPAGAPNASREFFARLPPHPSGLPSVKLAWRFGAERETGVTFVASVLAQGVT